MAADLALLTSPATRRNSRARRCANRASLGFLGDELGALVDEEGISDGAQLGADPRQITSVAKPGRTTDPREPNRPKRLARTQSPLVVMRVTRARVANGHAATVDRLVAARERFPK